MHDLARWFEGLALMLVCTTAGLAQIVGNPDGNTDVAGIVVDDETGVAVTDFVIERGRFTPEVPGGTAIRWGAGTERSNPRSGGEFHMRTFEQPGNRVWFRIIAPGYLPQPVVSEPMVAPAQAMNLIVRLKRGAELRGVVHDHSGNPVAAASVYLLGSQPLEIGLQRGGRYPGSRALTDEEGRFSIPGADLNSEQRVFAVDGAGMAGIATRPPGPDELIVTLPEPGKLVIDLDVQGDEPLSSVTLTWLSDFPPSTAPAMVSHEVWIANPGRAELLLTPGTYRVGRQKSVRIGSMGRGLQLDSQSIDVKAGQAHTLNLARQGFVIQGQVLGLKEAGSPNVMIVVRAGQAIGGGRNRADSRLPAVDALTCDEEGRFQTSVIAPGAYTVLVEAYDANDRPRGRAPIPSPSLTGLAPVTITKDAPPAPIQIQLQPLP